MSTGTRRGRGKRPAEQNDDAYISPAAKKQQSLSTRNRGQSARGRGSRGGRRGAKSDPVDIEMGHGNLQNNNNHQQVSSSAIQHATKSNQEIIDLDKGPHHNIEAVAKLFPLRDNNIPRLLNSNVYIEIDKNDPKYVYAIPADVLVQASSWFKETIKCSVREADEELAMRCREENSYDAYYELKSSPNDDGTSKWVLHRAPFTYLRWIKEPASLINPLLRNSLSQNPTTFPSAIISPQMSPPSIPPVSSSNTVSISKKKNREVQKLEKINIDLTGSDKDELTAPEINGLTPVKASHHAPANRQNPDNAKTGATKVQIVLNNTLTPQPTVAPSLKGENPKSKKPQSRPTDDAVESTLGRLLTEIEDGPPRVEFQFALDRGCDNEEMSGTTPDNQPYVSPKYRTENSEVNDSQYLAPATPILQDPNYVIRQAGEGSDDELVISRTEIFGQSVSDGIKNESIQKQRWAEQNQSAQQATAPISIEAQSKNESPKAVLGAKETSTQQLGVLPKEQDEQAAAANSKNQNSDENATTPTSIQTLKQEKFGQQEAQIKTEPKGYGSVDAKRQEKTPNGETLNDQGSVIMPNRVNETTKSAHVAQEISSNHVGNLDAKEKDDATGVDSFQNTVSEKESDVVSSGQQDILSGHSNKKIEHNNEQYDTLEPDSNKRQSQEQTAQQLSPSPCTDTTSTKQEMIPQEQERPYSNDYFKGTAMDTNLPSTLVRQELFHHMDVDQSVEHKGPEISIQSSSGFKSSSLHEQTSTVSHGPPEKKLSGLSKKDVDDSKDKSSEESLPGPKAGKAQKRGSGQVNEDNIRNSPLSDVPSALGLRNASSPINKTVEERISFSNAIPDEPPLVSLGKRSSPKNPSSSAAVVGGNMDTVVQDAPLQTTIEATFSHSALEKSSHSDASTQIIIPKAAVSAPKPLIVRPPRELCEAYDSFFSIINKRSPNFDAENINTAFSQIQMVQELAQEFKCPNITRRKLIDHLAPFEKVLWQAVKADPPRWLLLSISLQCDHIFREAIVHMVGRLQPYTKKFWPWNSTSPSSIPDHIHDLIEHKAQHLERLKSNVNYELFTSSISIRNKVLTQFNRSPETETTYDMVRLWRDWFSSSLAELKPQALVPEDRRYKDGVVYRKMAAGDNAYLPISKVFEEVMTEKDGGKFVPETFRNVAEDLGLMKAFAQKTVRELCESLVMLDVESEGIEYLTCTRVSKHDLPWIATSED